MTTETCGGVRMHGFSKVETTNERVQFRLNTTERLECTPCRLNESIDGLRLWMLLLRYFHCVLISRSTRKRRRKKIPETFDAPEFERTYDFLMNFIFDPMPFTFDQQPKQRIRPTTTKMIKNNKIELGNDVWTAVHAHLSAVCCAIKTDHDNKRIKWAPANEPTRQPTMDMLVSMPFLTTNSSTAFFALSSSEFCRLWPKAFKSINFFFFCCGCCLLLLTFYFLSFLSSSSPWFKKTNLIRNFI